MGAGRSSAPGEHDPADQRRQLARKGLTGVIVCGMFTAGAIAASLVLIIGAPHDKSPSGARVGGIVFAVFAVLLLPLTWYLWRRWHPGKARYLSLTVSETKLRRGDTVTANLSILRPDKVGDKLELGLVCDEYYDVRRTVQTPQGGTGHKRVTEQAQAFSDWRNPNRNQKRQSMQFDIPADAPCSYTGGAVSWAWRVAVRDSHHHRFDGHVDVPVWVSP